MNEVRKGMLAATATYTIFGLSFLFSKVALNITDPIILLWARFTLTYILLNLMLFTRISKISLRSKSLLGPILLGVFQPVLYFILENYGLKYTTTSFTGMIASISPVFTALLGAMLLKERPNAKQWLCITVSILGVLMVSLKSTGGANTPIGCICLVGAYLASSFYTLLSRRMSKDYTAFELTYIMFTVGFVFFTGWSFVQYRGAALPMMIDALSHREFTVAVVYLGVLSSVVAFTLMNYALARLPVARSAIFSSIATIVSLLAGVIVMHDEFTWISAVSFVLILFGVIGVNRFAEDA